MKRLPLLATFSLAACSFSPAQEATLQSAISRQSEALADARFPEIMRELQARGAIDWTGRLRAEVRAEAATFESPTEWLLARFAADGPYARPQLSAWRKWTPPWSATTAATTYRLGTRLNLWRFNRGELSIVNTLIHERTHYFGLVHPRDQTRATNQCDAAYVAGDLAEALLAARLRVSPAASNSCPALCAALTQRGLRSQCDLPRRDS